jgi:hypothetical protein
VSAGSDSNEVSTATSTYFIGPADVYGGDYGLYKTIITTTPSLPAVGPTSSKDGVGECDSMSKNELDVAHDPSKTHSVGKARCGSYSLS